MIEPSESGVLKQNRWAARMIPSSSRQLHVADGGYYENSGLSDLAEWLDRGLTELAQGPLKPPAEVLVIQIEGFPESKSEREDSQPHQTETLGFSQKGSFFQGAAPLITLNSVRGSGHTAFANHGFELLQHRWLIDKNAAVTIRHVRFVLPVITAAKKEAGKGGGWAPSWAEAKPEQPPLSWHLRGPEQQAIDEAWKTLVSERKKDFANLQSEQQESEWRETKSHPIDKVLHFLSTRPIQP
jgi:hypothetical protein